MRRGSCKADKQVPITYLWASLDAALQTDDGIEQTLGINYYAHALLTLGVLDLLRKNPRSRVVIMASLAEAAGQLDWENLK
jgi:NAD(P)-dependent dehydrogenase (short-subunit alcohol dehydrogenase family)